MKLTHLLFLLLATIFWYCKPQKSQPTINRFELVNRHNIKLTAFDSLGSLSVGNGEFAYTVDITGMQTFPAAYERGIPLGTLSNWGWHSIPTDSNYTLQDALTDFETCGERTVSYATQHMAGRPQAAAAWLRANPHRLHLGIIGLSILKENGEEIQLSDVMHSVQTLNLWTGKIESTFVADGTTVTVETLCHQQADLLSFRIHSPLIQKEKLKISMKFPYGSDAFFGPGYDWTHDERHTTVISEVSVQSALLTRTMDSTTYFVNLNWDGDARLVQRSAHILDIIPAKHQNDFECSISFSPEKLRSGTASFSETENNNLTSWEKFWLSGGAIDLSGNTDLRAMELERRIVLSQYLTKIQCSGSLPPQETGLTYNSWHGKFHLEMHWWHAAHFALWGRPEYLEKSLSWYFDHLDEARNIASRQGYSGARWQKMTSPDGKSSPSNVGEFLIWQQPHIIYFAELLYRASPTDETLGKYKELVFETAEFMASFAHKDTTDGKYHVCPPLIPAQEHFKATETSDPIFELTYWSWGLATAQKWRERLGMEKEKLWEDVITNMATLPKDDAYYLPTREAADAYSNFDKRRDHPIVVGAYGYLPNEGIDTTMMKRTFATIMSEWDWESTWGWDYPLLAMTATRLYDPESAVATLSMDYQKNTYLANGHNYQNQRLSIYLPGNGGLLAATAMMAAGFEGSTKPNPGFPREWKVKWEDLKPML